MADLTVYTGAQRVAVTSSQIQTYSAVGLNIVPAATPTDVFTLTGSATKTVKVLRVLLSGTQTTAGTISVIMLKRSTADTVGTSTAPTRVPRDSANAAATATFLAYTANPTLGTLVGNVMATNLSVSAPATASSFAPWDWEPDLRGQPVVLRGIAQVFAINFNAVTLIGGSLTCSITWTEE